MKINARLGAVTIRHVPKQTALPYSLGPFCTVGIKRSVPPRESHLAGHVHAIHRAQSRAAFCLRLSCMSGFGGFCMCLALMGLIGGDSFFRSLGTLFTLIVSGPTAALVTSTIYILIHHSDFQVLRRSKLFERHFKPFIEAKQELDAAYKQCPHIFDKPNVIASTSQRLFAGIPMERAALKLLVLKGEISMVELVENMKTLVRAANICVDLQKILDQPTLRDDYRNAINAFLQSILSEKLWGLSRARFRNTVAEFQKQTAILKVIFP